jgi:hypothetical protein
MALSISQKNFFWELHNQLNSTTPSCYTESSVQKVSNTTDSQRLLQLARPRKSTL